MTVPDSYTPNSPTRVNKPVKQAQPAMPPSSSSPAPPRTFATTITAAIVLLLAGTIAGINGVDAQPVESPAATVNEVPESTTEALADLDRRAASQRRSLAQLDHLVTDFELEDRLEQSGITFVHQVTDDAAKYWKPVHYDHGNGLNVADFDGDGLLDLYFLTQIGSNELWRNLGDGTFEDVTTRAGVGLADKISVAATFVDLDDDGDPDLYVTTVRMGNVLFENLGNGRFRDRTAPSRLGYVGHSSAPVAFDYDRDGLLDIFLTNVGVYTGDAVGTGGYYWGLGDAFQGHLYPERTELSQLYRNLGDLRFEDVSAATGLVDRTWAGDATIVDFDGDRWLDLYVPNMQGDDAYWVNTNGRFTERAAALFPKTPWGSMGVKAFDADNDGRVDLLLTDMHSDMSEEVGPEREHLKSRMQWEEEVLQGGANNIFGNAFFHNQSTDGEARFVEASDSFGLENYWPWGASTGDLNADGYEDVLIIASMNYPYRYGINSLKLNDRGRRFVDAELVLGIEPRRDRRIKTPWFELDCDTDPDTSHPLCEQRSGRQRFDGSLGSRTAIFMDLERDGDLDIVTGEFGAAPQVLVSNLTERREIQTLEIELIGSDSGREALGAVVQLRTGERLQTRVNDGKSGYLSQSSMPLFFGLGGGAGEANEIREIDEIRVLWPSGRTSVLRQPPDRRRLVLVEPTAP